MTAQTVQSPGRLVWRRLVKNKGAVASMLMLAVMIILAVAAPLVAPFDPKIQVLEYRVKPVGFSGMVLKKYNKAHPETPTLVAVSEVRLDGDSLYYTDPMGASYAIERAAVANAQADETGSKVTYWLGTDALGRDLLSRLLYGMRVSLSVGLVSVSIALVIGIVLGALAGFFRGWVDDVIMWLVNVVWSFPTILLVIAFSVLLGKGYWQTFVAIGISSWVDIARIVRVQFFSIREQEFVEATRALGFGAIRTMFRHMLPNALGPVIVLSSAGFATAILAEASLSFIGLGVQPPTPSWGQMIKDGYGYIAFGSNWTIAIFPCLAMGITVLAINVFGDGLRDAFDPKTSQR